MPLSRPPTGVPVAPRYVGQFGLGLWAAALSGLLGRGASAAPQAATAARDPLRARAKRVIFCFMDGGVSHVDSFDPKPKLAELDGQPFTTSANPTANGNRQWLKSPWAFQRHGQCGMPISALFPHIAGCADDLAVIRSMKADLPLHSTGVLRLHTGVNNAGRPSLGSWVTYGLGSENENLPGFVVLSFGVVPCGGLENFSGGFLPANYQATMFAADGTPIDNIVAADRDPRIQQAKLDLLAAEDAAFARSLGGDDGVESAIKNYEMAARMQLLVPDVLDLAPRDRSHAQTLRARFPGAVAAALRHPMPACPAADRSRRALRRNHVPPGASNGTWDQHGDLKRGHEKNALDTDQAVAALIHDLKAARPARRYAHRVGRRIWPHAPFGRAQRPRSSPRGLYRVAGRRRRQRRQHPRRHRRVRHASRGEMSTSTTCTPRCCTSWAWTTSGSPTVRAAATSA